MGEVKINDFVASGHGESADHTGDGGLALMLPAGAGLSCIAVIPRDDATQPLLPFYFALGSRRKVWAENLVPNICTLMRTFVMVVRQPFAVDMIELFQRYANKMIQTFPFCFPDIALDKCVRFGGLGRRFEDFCSRALPESIKAGGVFEVPVMDQMRCLNTKVL